ncbi:hypothetical protein LLH00_05635 [bacterium]|nr:hypothetical protein [bacterium]
MELGGFRLAGGGKASLLEFFNRPAPREVPAGMWKRLVNPLALIVLLVMTIFGALAAVAKYMGSPMRWQECAPFFLPLVWALFSLLHTRTILARGRLAEGYVSGMQKIQMKEGNYRRLFVVWVKLGPGGPGSGCTLYDVVDHASVEYFEKAWVLGEPVAVLHTPGLWPGALLPGKINAGALFQKDTDNELRHTERIR